MQHRLKHLLWKMAWNILHVRASIAKFVNSIEQDPWLCPFCKGPQESISHIILECSFAKILWRNSHWPLLTDAFCGQPFAAWIVAILRPHVKLAIPIHEVRKFQLQATITMDHIWFSRNQLVHKAVIPSPMQALTQIASTSAIHCKAWTNSTVSFIWSPPLLGSTKANFDVVLSSDFAVAATVVSNSNGNTIGAATKKILTKDVALGEALAALLAVQTATSSDAYSLILEEDALNAVLAIQQPQLFEG
jgi:hypothetical protein